MNDTFNLKLNAYLLLLIIPISVIGYYFAVEKENLFFVYEWMLTVLVITLMLYSIKNILMIRNSLIWVAISIFVFLIQFAVFGLFLGPFSNYAMIYVYYLAAIISFIVYVITLTKSNRMRMVPIIFIIITGIFTFYMVFISAMWGNGF
ncbi:hypothetical protein M3589_02235 [Heyndrickxia oleronia]|uniref:hypothetical protein n=1 Tax=Heyndrickxia oleronia TaxID=38875 RepID=UPI00203EB9DA|nr:hypothetical protein [Heyndrickxia oleronia]MCM3236536.1 hypothetical protein [Heyndrickxia oleronia]